MIRTVSIMPLIILFGCNEPSSEQEARHREALDHLEGRVLEAMCEPWGLARQDALARMFDAYEAWAIDNIDAGDTIYDLADDINEDDCAEAGIIVTSSIPIEREREIERELGACRLVMERDEVERERCRKLESEFGSYNLRGELELRP